MSRWLLLRHADVVLTALATEVIRYATFRQGKIVATSFFARNVLPEAPRAPLYRRASDNILTDIPDDAFYGGWRRLAVCRSCARPDD